MALTEKEIVQFVTFRVEYGCSTPALLSENRKNALQFYAHVQDDIRGSGYRISKRIRDIIWKTLQQIDWRESAPRTVSMRHLTSISMVNGNERRHPEIIMNGRKEMWIGFGWVDMGPATRADLQLYPLAVED